MPELAVTAIGRDRPGIVAAISAALLELDGNIEDSRMSILRGHFAVMLIVGVSGAIPAATMERRLEGVRRDLDLEAIAVNAVDELGERGAAASHVLTVYGADRPGIVHAVTAALAERGVNITDLETRLTGPTDAPLYAMMMEVVLGEAAEPELERALREIASRLAVEVSIRPLDAEAL